VDAWQTGKYLTVLTSSIIFTCEHGGYLIPPLYKKYFRCQQSILKSHRGWDKGALELAREATITISAPLIATETSRLLIDLNRSLHHPNLFSEFTRHCDEAIKQKIIDNFYYPYRKRVENKINAVLKNKQSVIHFSIHSFTPSLDNQVRNTDIGLLYDPERKSEQILCIKLKNIMQEISDDWRIRRNYPYRGNADGFTTHLRKIYSQKQYIGVEIEINQKIAAHKKQWRSLKQTIFSAIKTIK
jgi:predicted N-formylglutamate amidohydrolase